MKTFLRLLHFLKPFLGWVAVSILLGVLTIAANVGLMASSAYLISAAALHPSIAELQVTIVGVRFFGISRGVFRYAELLVSHSVNFKLLSNLRVWFYRKLEPLAPARLIDIHSGDLLTRAVNDIETLENFYVRVVAPPVTAAIVTLGMLVFLANYSLTSALALVAFLLTVGVGLPTLAVILSRGPGRRLIENRARLQTALIDGIQGLSDLLAYGQQENQIALIRQINRENAHIQTQLAVLNAANTALGVLLSNLGMLAIMIFSIPLVAQGNLDGVLLAVLALAGLASFEAVTPLPIAAQQLEVCLQAARRLFDLVDSEPAVSDPAHPLSLPTSTDLRFQNVTFSYAQDLPLALDHFSFDLPAEKHLAIVGPSGAGKSTLVKLLLRFWEPDSGQIYLGNLDIRSLK
ncbi:MAG: thiol reductant ABC exporter subunit CydC, partial [Anaerolineaceae bacterium]